MCRSSSSQIRGSQAGMSLIEVMAVVFMIGLASTLVVFTIPGRKGPGQSALEQLQSGIERLQDEAIVLGAPLGLDVDSDGNVTTHTYRRGIWAPAQIWMPSSDDVTIELETEAGDDERLVQRRADADRRNGPPIGTPPRLVLDPIGLVTQATFLVRGPERTYTLRIEENGDIRVEAR